MNRNHKTLCMYAALCIGVCLVGCSSSSDGGPSDPDPDPNATLAAGQYAVTIAFSCGATTETYDRTEVIARDGTQVTITVPGFGPPQSVTLSEGKMPDLETLESCNR